VVAAFPARSVSGVAPAGFTTAPYRAPGIKGEEGLTIALLAGPVPHPTGTSDAERHSRLAARFAAVGLSNLIPTFPIATSLTGSENVTSNEPVSDFGTVSEEVGADVSSAKAAVAGANATTKASKRASGRAGFTDW
jgi:hypothetical protein